MDTNMLILILSAIGAIAIASIVIFLYVIYKKLLFSLENIAKLPLTGLFSPENIDGVLQSLINNEKFQHFLVEAGALIGSGAKSGFGNIMGKGGKVSIESVIGGAIADLIQGRKGALFANSASQAVVSEVSNSQTALPKW